MLEDEAIVLGYGPNLGGSGDCDRYHPNSIPNHDNGSGSA